MVTPFDRRAWMIGLASLRPLCGFSSPILNGAAIQACESQFGEENGLGTTVFDCSGAEFPV